MKAALKVDILKSVFLISYFLLVLTAINAWATGSKKKGCGDSPFETNILKFEKNQTCYDVILEVSLNNRATFELSHVNIDFGCGTISNEWNSEGWKMESNHKDPTTGIGGIKIDEVSNFGKDPSFKSFEVKFTFCPSGDCDSDINSFNPKVGYKAGQCLYFERPSNDHCDKCGDNESDDGDNGDDDDGGDEDADNGDSNNDDGDDNCDSGHGDTASGDSGNSSDGTPDTEHPQLTVEVIPTDPTCLEPSGGTISLEIIGGTEPYTISWNNGESSPTLSGLIAGTYSFDVSDANGNISSGEVTLANAAELVIETLLTKPDCQGFNNGAIELTVTGGTEPYSFVWSNGAVTQNLTDLYAGTYGITVTDANGCSAYNIIPLYNETSIFLDAAIVQPSCQLGTAGSISITPSGGTAPYSYVWSGGETTGSIDELVDGIYEVTVTDQNGCSYVKSYQIKTDIGFDVFASVTKTNCFNDPIGAIDLTISGGTAPYTIEWSNGENTEDISELTSGNYTATITDALGCQSIYKTSVLENDISIGYESISIPSCNGNNDGAISINLSNGTAPYTIEWSNGSNEEDIANLTAGTYSVKVTDAMGCVSEKTFPLPEPDPVEINYSLNTNECTGIQDITVEASGGSLEYSYLWSDGSTSNILNNALSGVHSITVTDTRGCSATQEIPVESIESLHPECLISDTGTEVMCGSADNLLMSNLSGVISYSWTVSSSDGSWAITSASDQNQITYNAGAEGSSATFKLKVTYESGCEISCDKTVEVCIGTDNPDDNNHDNPNDGSTGGDTPDGGSGDDDSQDMPDDQNGSTDETGGDDGNCEENPDDVEEDCDCSSDDDDNTGDDNPDDPENDDDSTEGTENDNGDSDDSEEEDEIADGKPHKDKECTECFNATAINIVKEDDGYHYSMEIKYEDCRYDLSHLTIEIPSCYDIISYSNSMNWKMEEVYSDPTTGLSGLKVDDIPSFGKDPNMQPFIINFVLDSDNNECKDNYDLNCFAPVIAYKSATCVYKEVTTSECYVEEEEQDYTVNTYPNPTSDFVKIDMKNCDKSASYVADIYNFKGEKTCSYNIEKGTDNEFLVDLRSKKQGLYFLKLSNSKGICTTHRIVKY